MSRKLENELMAISAEIMRLAKAVEELEATGLTAAQSAQSKKTISKKPPRGKKVRSTAADSVYAIIKRSRKGVDGTTLIRKTGYNVKKVQNIIYRLKKEGRIKSEEKGIYRSA